MAKTLNLNRFRKRRAREEKEKRAAARRAQSGLTKGERARLAREQALRERRLEGLRREPPADGDGA